MGRRKGLTPYTAQVAGSRDTRPLHSAHSLPPSLPFPLPARPGPLPRPPSQQGDQESFLTRPRVRTGRALSPRDGILRFNNVKATSVSFLPKETTTLGSRVRLGFLSRHSAHGFLIPLSASGSRHPAAAGKALRPRAPTAASRNGSGGSESPTVTARLRSRSFPRSGEFPTGDERLGLPTAARVRPARTCERVGASHPRVKGADPPGPAAATEKKGVPQHLQGFCLFFNHIQEEGKPAS